MTNGYLKYWSFISDDHRPENLLETAVIACAALTAFVPIQMIQQGSHKPDSPWHFALTTCETSYHDELLALPQLAALAETY